MHFPQRACTIFICTPISLNKTTASIDIYAVQSPPTQQCPLCSNGDGYMAFTADEKTVDIDMQNTQKPGERTEGSSRRQQNLCQVQSVQAHKARGSARKLGSRLAAPGVRTKPARRATTPLFSNPGSLSRLAQNSASCGDCGGVSLRRRLAALLNRERCE